MKQQLLLSGFVVLFPKLIIFLVLARLSFTIKIIKYSILFIAFLYVLLAILACISIIAIFECFNSRFKESRLIIKMIISCLAFFAVLWLVRYNIGNLRRRFDYLLANWIFSSRMVRVAAYNHLA